MKNYKDEFSQTDGVAFPNTGAKNASGAGATDGTEFKKSMIDDIWGWHQVALDAAGLTPNGVDEQATVDLTKPSGRKSQMLDSLVRLFERRTVCKDTGIGTANAIDVAAVAALFEFYYDGMVIRFNPFEKNTGATTIDVDNLGNKSVVAPGGAALGGGEFQPDYIAVLVFDLGNDRFEYINIPEGPAHAFQSTVSVITNTTVIPYDDTIPQNTEGTEILTASITPQNKNSTIKVEGFIWGSVDVAGTELIAALFRDSGANAIQVAVHEVSTGGEDKMYGIQAYIEVPANDTVSTTFKLRFAGSGGQWNINALTGGSRRFGGVLTSYLRVTEILPKL
jgi:hypothetical protein